MAEVNCLYCGGKVPADAAECPHCGAVSHYQKKGYRAGARGYFIALFVGLVLVCFFLMFWLPR